MVISDEEVKAVLVGVSEDLITAVNAAKDLSPAVKHEVAFLLRYMPQVLEDRKQSHVMLAAQGEVLEKVGKMCRDFCSGCPHDSLCLDYGELCTALHRLDSIRTLLDAPAAPGPSAAEAVAELEASLKAQGLSLELTPEEEARALTRSFSLGYWARMHGEDAPETEVTPGE